MFGFFVGLFLVCSLYSFFGLRYLFVGSTISLILFTAIYWLITLVACYSFYQLYVVLESGSIFRSQSANVYLGITLTMLVTQLVMGSLLFAQDFGRLIIGAYNLISTKIASNALAEGASYLPSRRRFLSLAAAGVAAVPFFTMLYGISKGKYNYKIEKLKLAFKELPKSFEGLRVVQISDIHAGSFDSKEDVLRGVKMINALEPDVILFTGDMVNSSKDEVDPYIDIFSQLKSKMGNFAVLGNHDYYGERGMSEEETVTYRADFYQKFEEMGFALLNNETVNLEKDGEKVAIVGVENWGKGRWFPKRGDLDVALKDTPSDSFKILLSHDPTHWDEHVVTYDEKIQLTLSGHTHGMQFGINVPGFKWSPAQYRYPKWMGLYEDQGQYLYVNRGFGFLGFPGRVGMWPEITLIELNCA